MKKWPRNRATPKQREAWYAQLKYKPRNGQRAMDAAADAGKRYISLFAFPRAGKSYGAAKHVEPDLLCPDHHAWIVAPKYELGSKEFLYVWQDFAATGWLDRASVARSDVRSGNMVIEFPWGSFLRVVSADNPSSLRAEELDTVILAEASALNEVAFERHLFARTEKRGGKVLVPTTPMGKNWVYDYFRIPSMEFDPHGNENPRYDRAFWSAVVSADPDMVVPGDWDLADIYEPGVHTPEAIERGKRTLPPPIYTEQFGGGFASYAGLVLPFEPHKHIVPPKPIPDYWTHVVGWDHGSTQDGKTAILVGSYDPRGVLHLWGKIYEHGHTAATYLGRLRALLGNDKAPSAVSVDPSAKQVRIELSALGQATTIPNDKQIMAGIIRITQMLLDGTLVIHDGALPELEKELWRMEWDEKNPKKIADDWKYHCIAALRYMVLVPVQMPTMDLSEPELDMKDPKQKLLAEKRRFWAGWKKRMEFEEQQRQIKEWDNIFEEPDPFEEIGFEPQEFDLETGFYETF